MKAPAASAAGAGGTGKVKPSPGAADNAPAPTGPAISLLQFGDALYKAFAQQPEEAAARLPLTRYADYLHHFGFSVEREGRSRGAANLTGGLSKSQTATRPGLSAPSAGGGHLINYSSEDPSALADTADWGISAELRSEADLRCESVGALAGVFDQEVIAKQLTVPYNSVTWRQTATQCAVKKARCLYAWLCSHLTLQLRPLEEAAGEAEVGAAATTTAKASRSVPASKKSNRPARNKKETTAAQEPAGPVDPLMQALTVRRATPALLAQLYANMLTVVGVRAEVVTGLRKGVAPMETVEWAWNVVRIDGRSYLVDVAAALSDGILRNAPGGAAATSSGSAGAANAAAADGAKTAAAAGSAAAASGAAGSAMNSNITISSSGGVGHKGGVRDEADAAAGYGVPQLLSATPAALRRDFFFFTHPCPFLSSHLPSNPALSLVSMPTRAVHWVLQPCVTPAFYHYGLQLVSHPTHAAISVGSTPSYLSLLNTTPGTTELCCVLFSGTLQMLSEDVSRNTPLSPGWVWHQRDDTSSVETFTLTVPQAGYYVAVVGARSIRADPYSAAIVDAAASAFTPVVSYEVRVGFTSSGVPVLPRQYLSPSICRLMYPLCAQLTPGAQRFTVMPSCSNVLAVAVVKRTAQQQPTQLAASSSSVVGAAAAAVGNASSSSAAASSGHASTSSGTRTLLSFLPFQMKKAAFEGFAEVKAGDVVELWVLYGAPDRNGQQLAQRVGAAKTTSVESSALLEAKAAADKKKKKPTAAEAHPVDEAQVSRFEHALTRGELFQLFVGCIEVKHFISPTVMSVIQPQPTVEQEQAATLRRLAGVTEALMAEADHTSQYQATAVGSYFGAVATTTAPR